FSRVAERLVGDLPEGSALRRYGPTAAFFLPDAMRLVAPRSTIALLEARPMRLAARAFALGFISDMSFTGLHRLYYGSNASYELWTDFRTAEMRRQRGEIGLFSWREIPRLLAPSLSAYLDSHDYGFGAPSEARQEIQRRDRQQSRWLRDSLRSEMAWLPPALGRNAAEIFGEEIRLNPVEQDMLEQLEACRGRGQLAAQAGFDETVTYLQRQFRGVVADREEAARHLLQIHAYQ